MSYAKSEASGPATSSTFLDILYAEDFNDATEPTLPETRTTTSPGPPSPPSFTRQDLDAACVTAVSASRLEWEQSQSERRNDLLASIAASLHVGREAGEQTAFAIAEGTAATVLAMVAGALPHLCRQHGPAEVRALVDKLLPILRTEPKVTIRVCPEAVADLRRDVTELEADLAGVITVLPATVEPGDVKITWENGSLTRDTRHLFQAMQDALGQLGLQQAAETSQNRRMAHAD